MKSLNFPSVFVSSSLGKLFIMVVEKPFTQKEESWLFTKKTILYSLIFLFFFDLLVNFSQLRTLDSATPSHSLKYLQNDIKATTRQDAYGKGLVYCNILSSLYNTALILLIINYDAIPWLWTFVSTKHSTMPAIFRNHTAKSVAFLIDCSGIYILSRIPPVVLRFYVLDENIAQGLFSRWTKDWMIRDIANGRPIFPILLYFAFGLLVFGLVEQRSRRQFIVLTLFFQISFVVFYPIYMQPRSKYLLPMENGELKDTLTGLANATKFPVRNVFLSNKPLDSVENGISTFGWPMQRTIVIHETFIKTQTTADITALLAHKLSCWKNSNALRALVISQIWFNHPMTMILLFLQNPSTYPHFRFIDEFPKIGALVIWGVGFAPIIDRLLYTPNRGYMGRNNMFMADKFAAEHGYGKNLSSLLSEINASRNEIKGASFLYSTFYRQEPLLSERIKELENLEEKKEKILLPAMAQVEL